jgi:hypothetical protein
MRRSLIILAAILLAGAAIFQTAHWGARQICVARTVQAWDDLQWLRLEFKLGDEEIGRIRQLHEGYLPQCRRYCQEIARKNQELSRVLQADGQTPDAQRLLREIASIRVECQLEMLKHFEAVSHAMPPAQGRRYLGEMRRLTLGAHESLEQSMVSPDHSAHAHH